MMRLLLVLLAGCATKIETSPQPPRSLPPIVCSSHAPGPDVIARVELRGTPTRQLCDSIHTAAGQALDGAQINADIHALFRTRQVDDVVVEREPGQELVIGYRVRELATVDIATLSADGPVREKLIDEVRVMLPRSGEIATRQRLRRSADQITERLADAGFRHAKVDYTTIPAVDGSSVLVAYKLVAGRPATIRAFEGRGNQALKTSELAALMPSLQPGKVLHSDEASRELLLAQVWYYDHGMVNVRIGELAVDERDSDGTVAVAVTITEGDVFHLGAVHFAGDLVAPEADYAAEANLASGSIFSRADIIEARRRVQAFHARRGGKGESSPETSIDTATHRIALTFRFVP